MSGVLCAACDQRPVIDRHKREATVHWDDVSATSHAGANGTCDGLDDGAIAKEKELAQRLACGKLCAKKIEDKTTERLYGCIVACPKMATVRHAKCRDVRERDPALPQNDLFKGCIKVPH